jgi:hypothetical protein
LSVSIGRIERQAKNAGLRRENAPFIAGSFTISNSYFGPTESASNIYVQKSNLDLKYISIAGLD